ncbi:MAG TPA: MFS transporter [Pararobbsia sp.]|nr:MFS transporter [Pararobbsia sp.]
MSSSYATRHQWNVVLSSFAGTALEQYDFLLYGTASALVFNKVFFPHLDPLAGTLASLGTYAAGYFARGAGALLCGHLGDRVGRKTLLIATLLVMGIASTLIGLLPTYDAVGIWAPVMLTVLRIVQGFAIGGEQSGAIVFGFESAPPSREGVFASLSNAGGYGGVVLSTLALLLVTQLPDAQFLAWGWRIPFLASIVLVAIGLACRMRLPETPAFESMRASDAIERFPLGHLLRHHPREVFVVLMARLGEISWSVFVLVFSVAYVTAHLKLPKPVILTAVVCGATLAMCMVPVTAAWSERYGRKSFYIVGLLLSAVYVWPFLAILETRTPIWIVAAVVVALGVIHPLMYGPQGGLFASMYAPRVRFSGVSVAAVGAVIGGGVSPVICSALLSASDGATSGVAVFISAVGCVAALIVACVPARRRSGLVG